MNNLSRGFMLIVFWCAFGGDALELGPALHDDAALAKFDQFMIDYDRNYNTTAELLKRLGHFLTNLQVINDLTLSEEGTGEYDVNDMSDWSATEFAEQRANLNLEEFQRSFDDMEIWQPVNVTGVRAPAAHDWRSQGKVTTPKDQGSCGSCWAFSTTGNMECLMAIRDNRQQTLSEQQLVDCDQRSNGCDGGWMNNAVQSIMERGGQMTANSYPYTGRQGGCRFQRGYAVVQVSGNQRLAAGQEAQWRDFVGTVGCPSNAIHANGVLQNYRGGIIRQPSSRCPQGSNQVNHAVVTVGYGREGNQDFWVMKNSWGTGWGERGFFRIARGQNTCGVANHVNSARLK